jgi:non-homologous end joining protein Ku
VVDLMAALRESAGLVGKKKTASRKTANSKATAAKAKVTPTRRKAS